MKDNSLEQLNSLNKPENKIGRFNENHPELKEGEMFLMNDEENSEALVTYNSLQYKSKRFGTIAYSDDGNVLDKKIRPIFVNKEEFKQHFQNLKP